MKGMAVVRLIWLASALLLAAPVDALAQYVPGAPPPTYPPPAYPQAAVTQAARGPKVALNGFFGWQLASDISTTSGDIQLDDSVSYGASLGLKMGPGYEAEILWMWAPTTSQFTSFVGGINSTRPIDVDIHYVQIGGVRSFRQGIAEPFVAGTLGIAIIAPGTVTFLDGSRFEPSDSWQGGFTLGAGLKVWLFDRPDTPLKVALRGEARLLAPVYLSSASFYGGTGGSGFAVSGGIPFVQGNFSGALDISF